METLEELKARLNSSSQYLQSNDMRVVEVKEGYAKVEMIIDEQILNVHGFVPWRRIVFLSRYSSRSG